MTTWIPWSGGECPVYDRTNVRIRVRSGGEGEGLAEGFWWGRDKGEQQSFDLVAYRVSADGGEGE